jgi:hypothetical protein
VRNAQNELDGYGMNTAMRHVSEIYHIFSYSRYLQAKVRPILSMNAVYRQRKKMKKLAFRFLRHMSLISAGKVNR